MIFWGNFSMAWIFHSSGGNTRKVGTVLWSYEPKSRLSWGSPTPWRKSARQQVLHHLGFSLLLTIFADKYVMLTQVDTSKENQWNRRKISISEERWSLLLMIESLMSSPVCLLTENQWLGDILSFPGVKIIYVNWWQVYNTCMLKISLPAKWVNIWPQLVIWFDGWWGIHWDKSLWEKCQSNLKPNPWWIT